MGMDRNTVIGFVLLAGLLFLYLFLSTKNSQELQKQKQAYEDSVARVQQARKKDSVSPGNQTVIVNSLPDSVQGFQRATLGKEKWDTVENDVMQVVFTNKGGQPKAVILKKYKSADGKPVTLLNTDFDRLSYRINTQPNASSQTADFYFQSASIQKNPDGRQLINFLLNGNEGKTITHQYVISPGSYLIDFNIQLNAADKLLTQGVLNLNWQNEPTRHERDVTYERQQSQIGFLEDGDFDYVFSKSQKKFEKPVRWLSVKQQFFNSTLIATNNFNNGGVEWMHQPSGDTSNIVAKAVVDFQIRTSQQNSLTIPLQLYYGPNDYKILKRTAPDLDKMVNLGQGFYSFVLPINKFIVMPVFDFFKKFISSYGLVIALLTLFI